LEQKHPSRRWTDVLKHRWPTVLGIAVAALTVFDLQGGTELVALTMLMPVVYLGAAALDRRWFAWVVLLAGVAVLVVIPASSQVVPSMIFLLAALVFLVVGVARRQLRKPGGLALQTVGCSPSVRPCWSLSTWIRRWAGTSWLSPSSATPAGTLTTICETGWLGVRTRSGVPL
jgi:hypothetical protein